MSTFHLFTQLPPELRHSVYLHATPPRVVKIEADFENWDDFWERWALSSPADMYVHPEILYFTSSWDRKGAPNERFHRRQWKTQSTLEAHGFTTQKPRQAHWPLEDQFPFEVILNDKQTVYNLFRRGRLRSSCRIPELLHTCCESRNLLISAGYELAYSTRAYPATTWFNFKTDVLYIQDAGNRKLLYEMFFGSRQTDNNYTPFAWGEYKPDRPVSQFRPHDLRRIRRLVCDRAGPTKDFYYISCMMPNLCHVYVSLWDDIPAVLSSSRTPPAVLARVPRLHLQQQQQQCSKTSQSLHEHQYMLRAEDIDMVWASQFKSILSHLGVYPNADWNAYTWARWQQEHGLEGSFFRFLESHMTGLLQGVLDEARDHAPSDSQAITGGYQCLIPEESPRFQFVALGPIGLVEEIHYNRQAHWQLVQESRESWRQSQSRPQSQPQSRSQMRTGEQQQDGQASTTTTTTQPPEPTFRLAEFLPNLGEYHASVEWWVMHGKGITQRPKFHVF
ncbi:2EXR family [Microdochium nivale]|nr:2EXR family [Microdochium nivale]